MDWDFILPLPRSRWEKWSKQTGPQPQNCTDSGIYCTDSGVQEDD